MSANLYDTLTAAGDPAAVFLEAPGGDVIRYGDLDAATGRIANALVGRGVRPGDRVLVQVEKSPTALLLYLAVVRTGAIYLPLNTGYTRAEASYFVEDAEPTLIVCDPISRADFNATGLGARIETLDSQGEGSLADLARTQRGAFATAPRAQDDLAAILYTSGTTGRSKGAMLSHRNLVSNAETLADLWRFTAADVLIHALPIFHVHGLFVATHTVMIAGASMLFRPKFEPSDVLGLMPRATVMMGVPTHYTRLLEASGLTREATAEMRLFVSGSAPLQTDTHRQFMERTGHSILERYGMTETGMNTSNPYAGVRLPGTVGPPLPGVSVRVTDVTTGRQVNDGEIGVLEVRGDNVFRGYWRNPGKTAEAFRTDGYFITGDLGVIDPRGYVSIVGRGKDLIISGGLNVYPKEIEAAIDGLEGVVESAVVAAPHPDFGEAVVAFVVPDAQGTDETAIRSELAGRLAKFKLPKRVLLIEALPRNTMGKVQKAELRARVKDLFETG
ncbi:MAG: malonyl-CoA synthase [Caulobacteraceae bacterium]|nr:malonyl-CoA synthase [Caulobacteraceae bacterium]